MGTDQTLSFSPAVPGGRLDSLLATQYTTISRSRFKELILSGNIQVNGDVVSKPSLRLEGGELIEIFIPAPRDSTIVPEDIPINVLFENEDLIVINKDAGMVVHPSAGHETGTLVHAVLAHSSDIQGVGGEVRPGVVHRLDKDTSGILLMAKNDLAHRKLQAQFKERSVEKMYMALVDGKPPTPVGKIDAPIGRDPANRKRMAVVSAKKGRESITVFHTTNEFSAHTLLEVHPQTGRTHQIRVHLAYLDSPIVADTVYGRRHASIDLTRHFLHAARLTIRLPGKVNPSTFEAPLPDELSTALEQLK
jgi:23S rRNA pseudouridine1911/1915/1917 synthase